MERGGQAPLSGQGAGLGVDRKAGNPQACTLAGAEEVGRLSVRSKGEEMESRADPAGLAPAPPPFLLVPCL